MESASKTYRFVTSTFSDWGPPTPDNQTDHHLSVPYTYKPLCSRIFSEIHFKEKNLKFRIQFFLKVLPNNKYLQKP